MEKEKSTKPKQSEDALQAECFQWLYNNYPLTRGLVYHVRNGGGSIGGARQGNKMKAMGVVPGIPDLCHAIRVPFNREIPTEGGKRIEIGVWGALYVELKTEAGRLSPEQIKCHQSLVNAGNRVEIARTFDQYKAIVLDYLKDTEYVAST